jgi:hypothetical protein
MPVAVYLVVYVAIITQNLQGRGIPVGMTPCVLLGDGNDRRETRATSISTQGSPSTLLTDRAESCCMVTGCRTSGGQQPQTPVQVCPRKLEQGS